MTNKILDRVLEDVKNSQNSSADTTMHSVYVSGVFEPEEENKENSSNKILDRVLEDVKNSQDSSADTTMHSFMFLVYLNPKKKTQKIINKIFLSSIIFQLGKLNAYRYFSLPFKFK